MLPKRRILTSIAAALAFALVGAACGGSSADDDAGGSDGAAPATTQQVTTTAPPDVSVMEPDHDDPAEDQDANHDDGADHEEGDHDGEAGNHEENDGDEGVIHDDGEEGHDVEIPEDARVVFVTMDEWGYDPAEFSFKAGETVVFRINNAGIFEHEFRLSNTHRIEEHIASGHEGHGDEGDGHHADGDIFIEIEAGGIGELVVTFPEDMTVFTDIVCLLPDHYENGMVAEFSYDA